MDALFDFAFAAAAGSSCSSGNGGVLFLFFPRNVRGGGGGAARDALVLRCGDGDDAGFLFLAEELALGDSCSAGGGGGV